eukprot:233523-Hanusia_phi.AAC.1
MQTRAVIHRRYGVTASVKGYAVRCDTVHNCAGNRTVKPLSFPGHLSCLYGPLVPLARNVAAASEPC